VPLVAFQQLIRAHPLYPVRRLMLLEGTHLVLPCQLIVAHSSSRMRPFPVRLADR
jgi:hypothetical protein